MKVRIEIDPDLPDNEIIVRCHAQGEALGRIEKALADIPDAPLIPFFKGAVEYYIPLECILFFEAEDSAVYAHTVEDAYRVKNKLYLLEELLPHYFVRASKSAIINTRAVKSLERNITSFSVVCFEGTHKKMYVSRSCLKNVVQRLRMR